MKKTGLLSLLALLLCLVQVFLLPISAEVFTNTTEDGLAWSFDTESGVLAISGNGAMATYSKESPAPWAAHNSAITSVVIGDGVSKIGAYAFYNCRNLMSVQLGSAITEIGEAAFQGCYRLIEVYNKSGLAIEAEKSTHGYVAFYAKNITASAPQNKFTIENGSVLYTNDSSVWLVNYVGTEIALVVPSNVTDLNDYAFLGCQATSIQLPASLRNVGNGAFADCPALNTLTVDPANTLFHSDGSCIIETAAKKLVAGCQASIIPTDGSVEKIWDRAFRDCYALTEIKIPDTVTYIGKAAFSWCTKLTEITIPASVTKIDDKAFADCVQLTDVVIGKSVIYIGTEAFAGCKNLKTAYYDNAKSSLQNCKDGNESLTAVLHCKDDENHFYRGTGTKVNELQHTKTCLCGDVLAEDHNWDSVLITVEPTYTTDGEQKVTCSTCQATKTEVVPMLHKHAWSNWTATDDGQHTRTCACGEAETAAHDYPLWINQNASMHKSVCNVCRTEVYADHAWNAGEITVRPTATEDGKKTFTCSDCGITKTESIEKLGGEEAGFFQKFFLQSVIGWLVAIPLLTCIVFLIVILVIKKKNNQLQLTISNTQKPKKWGF